MGFKQKQSDSKALYFSLGHTKTKGLYNELTTDLNNDILPRILQVFKMAPVLTEIFLMHLMMTLIQNLRSHFWKWGHVNCM